MKKNVFKSLALISGLFIATTSFAQEAEEAKQESKLSVSGGADVYSKYGFKKGITSFTGAEGSLELGMANVRLEHTGDKVGAVVDLGFGKRAEEFTGNEINETAKIIQEAYLTWEAIDDLTITAGMFGTHIGYELLHARDNKNYSMSYAFSNGPFLNTGLKLDYKLNDEFGVMVGATLPTDYRTAEAAFGTPQKTIIAQVNYSAEETSAAFNFTTGSANVLSDANVTQFDIVLDHSFSDEISLGFNGTYKTSNQDVTNISTSWYAAAIYLNYAANDKFDLTYRGEYFDDEDGLAGITGNVISNTLSANYKVTDNLTIIPEVRGDLGSNGIFQGSRLNIFGLIAGVYSF